MKKLTLVMVAVFTGVIASGQQISAKTKGSGGGGGGATTTANSPASASSGAANTGGQQTGYVYRLRHFYHIQYGTRRAVTKKIPRDTSAKANETWAITRTVARVISCDTAKKRSQDEKRQVRVTDPCPSNSDTDTDPTFDTVKSCGTPCGTPAPFTLTQVRTDSISRYWERPRKLFSKWRLRVAITQNDSGKLQVSMYDNGFPKHPGHFDDRVVDYTEIRTGSKRVGDHAIPISADDSAQNFYLQIDNKAAANDPIVYISLPYALTQYGAFTIPYKYRFAPKNTRIYTKSPQNSTDSVVSAPSESTGSINVAFYVGRKWGRTRFYYDQTKTKNTLSFMLSGFVGPTLVSLSSVNVAYPHNTDSLPSQSIALSLGGAATLEWRLIDLGLFIGADYSLPKHINWVYDKKVWIGFGLGINLGMFAQGPTQFQL